MRDWFFVQSWLRYVSMGVLVLLMSSCQLLGARKDVEEIQQAAVITGAVVGVKDTSAQGAGPVIVAAYSSGLSGLKIEHYAVLHEPGSFELMVSKGQYRVFAFEDRNSNLTFDEGEAFAYFGEGATITAEPGGLVMRVDMALQTKGAMLDFKPGFAFPPKPVSPLHSTLAGAVANLDEPIYSARYGEMGYWNGVEFFREVGGNVYFLEPYDPNRIPVLFVHGASGSPQDWRYFFDHLDKSKYQAWFFYYPSASAIEPMSTLLSKKLWDLQAKYHFSHLHLVAHSAGGLVSRSFLGNYGVFNPYIDSFISISTPWGGEKLAELGVQHSPVVIPSWEDMQPGSSFNRNLFSHKLPPNIKYYMLFGYKGGLTLLRPNNDGTVTLASELDRRAQAEALGVYGFDEDHNSILHSPETFDKVSALIASVSPGAQAETQTLGSLAVGLITALPQTEVRGPLNLSLEQAGHRPQVIPVEPGVSTLKLDAVQPGDYTLRISSLSARAEHARYALHIEAGQETRVEIHLTPSEGMCGLLVDAASSDKVSAGARRELLSNLVFKRVSLRGEGIVRGTPEYTADFGQIVFDRDILTQGAFCFVDLQGGNYTVEVEAEGYEPYSGERRVEPGEAEKVYYVPLRKIQ